jgi:anti-sigma factor RsiW
MNHQPFEEWILGDEDLDQEKEQALGDHLQSCESCSSLAQSWQAVRHEIESEPQAAPLSGFTQRWQARLVQKRIEQQRRLAWGIFGLCLGIALIILGIIYAPEVTHLSPGAILASLLYNVTLFLARANQTRGIIEQLGQSVTPAIPIAIGVLAASSLSALSFFWIVVMWKIVVPKGVKS